MARWFRRKSPEPFEQGLVASAAPIDLSSRSQALAARRRRADWQREAWDYYENLGEVMYGANFIGNALGRLRLFVAERSTPNEDPVEVEGDDRANEALQRLSDAHGSHFPILQGWGVNTTVAGEGYLVGTETEGEENWGFYSIEDFVPGPVGKWKLTDETGQARELTSDKDFALRMWLANPRRRAQPISPLKGVRASCEHLLILERGERAVGTSRFATAGFLLKPSELDIGAPTTTRALAGGGADLDPFTERMLESIVASISNEGSAGAVAPIVVTGKAEHLKEFRHIDPSRKYDDHLDSRYDRTIRRIAGGIDLPAEVLLGIGDINHWGAWFVGEDTWKSHLEWKAIEFCSSLTVGYFRPALEEMGHAKADDLMIWFDPTQVTMRPNRSEDAKTAHGALAISNQALRRELGFNEDDAPTEEEFRERLAATRGSIDPLLVEMLLRLSAPREPITVAPEKDEEMPPEEMPQGPPSNDMPTPSGMTASGRRNPGSELAELDRDLRARIHIASDATLRRALERAGNMLRSRARKDQALRQATNDVPTERVAATLGPAVVETLGISDAELLRDAFGALQAKFMSWVRRAQSSALAILGLSPDELSVIQQRDAEQAWTWFESALHDAAVSLLYNPDPEPPPLGEFEDDVVVPYGLAREAVARAGGSQGDLILAEVNLPGAGIGTGPVVLGALQDAGGSVEAYRWVYGAVFRARPFEPHQDLDGVTFTNFDDEVLLNPDSFPPVSHFIPGDHDGCVCTCEPIIITPEGDRLDV